MFSSLNLGKIIGVLNKSISLVNQAIPIYKQVKPIYSNVKNMVNTYKTIRKEENIEIIKTMKELERPTSNFKSNTTSNVRGEFDLDTLTFFQ